ncbi:MAG: hypothetical protein LLG97_11345 [Deltaproteobacteria bacterium]|nr:hypothetical protein [Deltaproteobacteria bacterium]
MAKICLTGKRGLCYSHKRPGRESDRSSKASMILMQKQMRGFSPGLRYLSRRPIENLKDENGRLSHFPDASETGLTVQNQEQAIPG